jgi:hypothetical protein
VTKYEVFIEPNSGHFFRPQCTPDGTSDAPYAVVRLSLMVYADLHKAAAKIGREITVVGPELSSHGEAKPSAKCRSWSPVAFIAAMGKAKAELCREMPETCDQPLWDWFSIHPYGLSNSEPPDRVHFDGTLGFADYQTLRRTLCEAFGRESGQSCWVPVFYSEYGVQTLTPQGKVHLYKGKENVASVDFLTQVRFYQTAIRFTFCQRGVIGLLLFLNSDEPSFKGWQSGGHFVDDSAKPSLEGIRQAMLDAREGVTECR